MGIYIKTNETCSILPGEKDGKFSLPQLQKAVGGYIEQVAVGDGYMIVNEEGLCLNLPVNHIASYFADRPIVGDVVFCLKREME